jgi:hypothetical protein
MSADVLQQLMAQTEKLSSEEQLRLAGYLVEHARQSYSGSSPRIVRLAGLWQGYSFSEEDIRAARREAWSGLGQDLDG